MGDKKELTATESCRHLGITLDALYRLLYAGKLPGRKVEGIWRIPLSAVEQRLRERETRNG